jgi:hypothetical protein
MKLGRLPSATHPKRDELLSSWLTRMAHAHLIKTYSFGKSVFPGVSLWNRDLDKIAPESVLQTLAVRTVTSSERIRQTILRRYEGVLYLRHNPNGNTNWILPLGIYHRTHRQHGLLFCPECLRRDGATPYYRTHWRLAFFDVCTTCGVYLHDSCPECKMPITFFRVELGHKSLLPDRPISSCFNCRFDLTTTPVVMTSMQHSAAQTELLRIMQQGWNEQVSFPHLYFDVLHQLVKILTSSRPICMSLQKLVDKETSWSPLAVHEQVRKSRIPFEYLPLAVRGGIIQQAQWLLTDWPDRFLRVMKQTRTTSTPLFYDMAEIPFWYYNVVKENLYINNVNRRFSNLWS